jgi:lipopolysaccharide transport system ATP-binding protein
MAETAAYLENVSKRYRLGARSLRELVPTAFHWLNRREGNGRGPRHIWALDDVSFSLRKGEALGIIGPNGAGKSTILKLLARVTFPTTGEVQISGRVCPLIEVGAGFHPDLTGRENIFLNGTILGLSRKEIARKFDVIVEFSGLRDFIDTPVKRYSSGMYMRLAFSISAHVEPEMMLVDEVLAVGDHAFQQRCLELMRNYRRRGTVVFVSHNLEAIRSLCGRALLLDQGRVVIDGPTNAAVEGYHALLSGRRVREVEVDEDGVQQRLSTGEAEITRVWLRDQEGREAFAVRSGERAKICCEVEFREAVEEPVFGFFIAGPDGTVVYDMNTHQRRISTGRYEKGRVARIEFSQPLPLAEGTYQVSLGITRNDQRAYCCWRQNALTFFVHDDSGCGGLASLGARLVVDGRVLE